MIIWSTRGRDWGHRFLRHDGASDPLLHRDRAFEGTDDDDGEVLRYRSSTLAMRFEDPEGRKDAAGRPILHELIINGPEAHRVSSLEEGIAEYWPLVADEYARVWDQPNPPEPKA